MPNKKTEFDPLRERTDLGLEEERAKTDLVIEQAAAEGERRVHPDLEVQHTGAGAALRSNLLGFPASAAALAESEAQPAPEMELDHERAETDERLRRERDKTDEVVGAARERLLHEEAAHALSKTALVYRDEILALVGHELRNPLTAIALRADALLEPPLPGQTELEAKLAAKEIADDIGAACAQMTRLVGELLDAASADMGRLKVTLVRGDVVPVVREALAASTPLLKRQSLSLQVIAPPGPLFAWFDRGRLLQVFANLLGNALKFTAPGGTISVSVAKVGAELQFCVADSGCGIPPRDLSHVFERFWQVGKSDARGLGLGLYICKSILEAHGGTIRVASDLGIGTRFLFTLPEAA